MEELSKIYNDIKFVSCHPGWVDTPGVESAYGKELLYLWEIWANLKYFN
jgi:hypothetical protein